MTSTPTPAVSARPGDGPVALVAGARAAQVLSARMPEAVVRREEAFGEETVVVGREHLVDAVTLLRDDPDAAYAVPLCVHAVDFPDRDPRFDVVYQLRSLRHNDVARLVVQVAEDDAAVPSLEGVMPGFD